MATWIEDESKEKLMQLLSRCGTEQVTAYPHLDTAFYSAMRNDIAGLAGRLATRERQLAEINRVYSAMRLVIK